MYVSFILLDLACLITANVLALLTCPDLSNLSLKIAYYSATVVCMAAIDVAVTIIFHTLNKVLGRNRKKEIIESLKHVLISFALLALLLLAAKHGGEFFKATVFLAYLYYFVLIVLCRTGWKTLHMNRRGKTMPTALLVTTAGYAEEGLGVVENAGVFVKGIFITDARKNRCVVRNIHTMVNLKDVAAFLCRKWIDRVYMCGPQNIEIPEKLLTVCRQMDIPVLTEPTRKSLEYEVVKIRTAFQKDDMNTGLSFFESERDIPFKITRLYTIFESQQDKQKGFHAHKQSWHLMFCPYGNIDVLVDTGRERRIVALNNPSTGIILHPSVWREMIWKTPGSVLCVAASGHYDADKLRDDYDAYLKFLQEKERSATIESAAIMGD